MFGVGPVIRFWGKSVELGYFFHRFVCCVIYSYEITERLMNDDIKIENVLCFMHYFSLNCTVLLLLLCTIDPLKLKKRKRPKQSKILSSFLIFDVVGWLNNNFYKNLADFI